MFWRILPLALIATSFFIFAESATCPASGIVCYPGDCCKKFQQCSGSTFHPAQDVPPGTVCKGGIFVFPNECTSKCPSSPPPSSSSSSTTSKPPSTSSGSNSGGGGGGGSCKLSQIFTQGDFDKLFPNANGANKKGEPNQHAIFSYSNIINAAANYPNFACEGDTNTRKRELAAFLAHASQETSGRWGNEPFNWGFYFSNEVGCDNNKDNCKYCQNSAEYPCAPNKGYLYFNWNYNYGQMSKVLFNDKNKLLQDPDLILSDGTVAFRTAFWFWMTAQNPKPSCHDVIIGKWKPSDADTKAGRKPGFGMTTNIINGGLECTKPTPDKVKNRVGYYKEYCSKFGIPQESDATLYCDKMQHY